jgi:ferredoxin/flavodoxin
MREKETGLDMKTDVYYFSGTGNTRIVAEFVARAFRMNHIDVELVRIRDVLKGKTQIQDRDPDLIGIGYPILGFGMPRIVDEFIALLPQSQGKRIFLFMTASDFVAVNNGASKKAIKALRCRGYDVFYERIICMASNWMVKYPDALAKQLYYTAEIKAGNMCQEILSGKKRTLRLDPITRAVMELVHAGEELSARLFGRMLAVTDACTHCDTCVANCPADNIRRQNGRIRFGWNCLWCMRCVYACPQQAISPRLFRFCVLKGGYNLQDIIDDPAIKEHYITEETRGYFRHFVPYIQQPDA